jgi:hypothetical protein
LLQPEEDVIPNIWTLNNLIKQLFVKEERGTPKSNIKKETPSATSTPPMSTSPPPPMHLTWANAANIANSPTLTTIHSPITTLNKKPQPTNLIPNPTTSTPPAPVITKPITPAPTTFKPTTNMTPMAPITRMLTPGVAPNMIPKPQQQSQPIQQPQWATNSSASLLNFSAILPNLQPPPFLLQPQQHPQQLTKSQLQQLIQQQQQHQQKQPRPQFSNLQQQFDPNSK